jgi:menaquinone-dependent protoporphyrinogen oxidase
MGRVFRTWTTPPLTVINARSPGLCQQGKERLAMLILVLFSTTEGHTQKLAHFAAARLRGYGYDVQLHDAARSGLPHPAEFDAAVLLASVHLGRYQRSFFEFARKYHDTLNAIPSAFVSVSLSAAGDNPSDLAGIRMCVNRLECNTSWHPVAVHHAGGAILFSSYGLLTKLAMKYIARRRGMSVKTSENYDLTDYTAFGTFIDDFAARAVSATQKTEAAQ